MRIIFDNVIKIATQETFLRIFRSIRNSWPLNRLKPYIFKIANVMEISVFSVESLLVQERKTFRKEIDKIGLPQSSKINS